MSLTLDPPGQDASSSATAKGPSGERNTLAQEPKTAPARKRPLSTGKWHAFKRSKRAYFALLLLVGAAALSLAAELIANNAPLLLYYKDRVYFPVLVTYQGHDLGLDSPVEPDYKSLQLGAEDFVVWPLIRWGYNESNNALSSYPSEPSTDNLLGTDDRGRDILARLIYGFRVSIAFGLAEMVLAVILATLIGGLQGYLGGKVDIAGQRAVEIWSALPYLYVLTLVVNIFEPGLMALILVASLFSWISLAAYVRSEYLKLRKMEFVLAARSMGASTARIIVQHIFPNSLTPIVTFAPFILGNAIVELAVLDYLGLGVRAPTASIGELLRQGRSNFMNSWWLAVFPFLALITTMISLNFVGEGVREAFDPRRSRR